MRHGKHKYLSILVYRLFRLSLYWSMNYLTCDSFKGLLTAVFPFLARVVLAQRSRYSRVLYTVTT
jgi:hypothetical protein